MDFSLGICDVEMVIWHCFSGGFLSGFGLFYIVHVLYNTKIEDFAKEKNHLISLS